MVGSLAPVPSRCYRCHAITSQNAVCGRCKSSVKLSHAWINTYYDGPAKKVIHKLKFDRCKEAARVLAESMACMLPRLPDDTIVCHVPTAGGRIRSRGYDQARLMAKGIARRKGLRYDSLLIRRGKSRQVGASRRERFRHLEKALSISRDKNLSGKYILLIDDVTTTGATIEAAAKVLKEAGAERVDAAVFAQP